VTTETFDIVYAAHTASCTFLLDAEGMCRRIVMVPKGKRRESSRSAAKCVGAQYVASLDPGAAGGLVEMPRVGTAMLFARIGERGRISLVRTGVLTSFESIRAHDPFAASASVETSAPALSPRRPGHAGAGAPAIRPSAPRTVRTEDHDDDPVPDSGRDAYHDPNERTQRIPALREDESSPQMHMRADIDSLETDYETSEYESRRAPEPSVPPTPAPEPRRPSSVSVAGTTRRVRESDPIPRSTMPSNMAPLHLPAPRAGLRISPHDVTLDDDFVSAPDGVAARDEANPYIQARGAGHAVASRRRR